MRNKNFAVFILTHGRPNDIRTDASLDRAGYTGKRFYIVDNHDSQVENYKKKFGDKVVVFDKDKAGEATDAMDNFGNMKAIIFARNACFDIAKNLGLTHFIQLDDDYNEFFYTFNNKQEYKPNTWIGNLDRAFDTMLDLYKSTPMTSFAMAQGGDFIGGEDNVIVKKKHRRKCMNSFICAVDRPFKFTGTLNEDVTTYTLEGGRGKLFFTTSMIRLRQQETQQKKGGISDMYEEVGTYAKSFYTVMACPSSVSITSMGDTHYRIHHRVDWRTSVPLILSEELKK